MSTQIAIEMGTTMRRCVIIGICIPFVLAGEAKAYKAYVSNEKSNTVSIIDTAERKVVGTIKVGQRPRGIAVTKDQKYVLVAVGDDDTIQMIDTGSNKIVDTLPSGPDPELFTDDPAGRILYVANENDNTVTIIDIERRARIGDVEVGVRPKPPTWHISSTPLRARSLPMSWSMRGHASRNSRTTARNCGCHRRSAVP